MTDDLKVAKPMVGRVVARKPPYRMFDNEPASKDAGAVSAAKPANRHRSSLIPPTVAPVPAPVPVVSAEAETPAVSGPVGEGSGR